MVGTDQHSSVEKVVIKLLLDNSGTMTVSCPKPARLRALVSQLEKDSSLSVTGNVHAYCPHSAPTCAELHTQEDFDAYLKLDSRLNMLLVYPVA